MQRYKKLLICTASFSVTFFVTLISQPRLLANDRDNITETFQIERNGDFVLVPITIDDREYQFVLDTGSSVTVFDASLKPYLIPSGKIMQLNEVGSVELFESRVGFIGKSRLQLAKQAVCHDLSDFRKRSGHDIRGFLGMDFLIHHVIEIDFDGGRVAFLKNSESAKGEIVPIEFFFNGIPVVEATVAGDETNMFLVDTGLCGFGDGRLAFSTFRDLARTERLTISKEPYKAVSMAGVATAREGTLSEFRIGTFRHSKMIFGESNGNSNRLGLGYVSRFKMTFDFGKQRLYLAEGKRFHRPSLQKSAVGFSVIDVDGHRVMSDVDERGIGHKSGARESDRILDVSGQDATAMTLFELRRLLRPGVQLKLSAPDSTNVRIIRLVPND